MSRPTILPTHNTLFLQDPDDIKPCLDELLKEQGKLDAILKKMEAGKTLKKIWVHHSMFHFALDQSQIPNQGAAGDDAKRSLEVET